MEVAMMARSIITSRARLALALIAITLIISVALALNTSAETEKERPMKPFDGLLAQDEQTRDRAVDKFLDDRKSVIDQLISIVDRGNVAKYNDETRCAAAYLLGELRAEEGVPVLSKSLAHPLGRQVSSDISRYDAPIFTALVKIGRPAVPAMFENIESSDNPILRKNSMGVLLHVLGGKTRLLEVLGKVHDRAVKENRPPIIARRLAEAKKWAEGHYKYTAGYEEPLY
jgi:hypothetical protein